MVKGQGIAKPLFQLRTSTESDKARIFNIWESAVKATHHFLSEKDILEISLQVKTYVDSASFIVVCNQADSPIGFMGMTDNKIDALFLDPLYFGQGAGRRLIEHAFTLFHELYVDVNEDNGQAVGFYKKLGFHVISRSDTDDEGRPFPLLKLRSCRNAVIETERLILRQWREEDLEPFSRLNADARVMEHFDEYGFCFFAAELKSTGELIGMIGLNRPNYKTPFTPCVEIGWRIAYEHWNKGYATEGATGALAFGFEQLHLNKIASFTAVENTKSMRIMEKIGMTRDTTGDFDHPNVPKEHCLCSHVLYWMHNPRR